MLDCVGYTLCTLRVCFAVPDTATGGIAAAGVSNAHVPEGATVVNMACKTMI